LRNASIAAGSVQGRRRGDCDSSQQIHVISAAIFAAGGRQRTRTVQRMRRTGAVMYGSKPRRRTSAGELPTPSGRWSATAAATPSPRRLVSGQLRHQPQAHIKQLATSGDAQGQRGADLQARGVPTARRLRPSASASTSAVSGPADGTIAVVRVRPNFLLPARPCETAAAASLLAATWWLLAVQIESAQNWRCLCGRRRARIAWRTLPTAPFSPIPQRAHRFKERTTARRSGFSG
jgi:hypothetical protein